jgi:hypothetical protein
MIPAVAAVTPILVLAVFGLAQEPGGDKMLTAAQPKG